MPACRPSFNLSFPNMKCNHSTAKFGVVLDKIGESTGEVYCGTIQDWRVHVMFGVALNNSEKYR
jgi:hypothetical protein